MQKKSWRIAALFHYVKGRLNRSSVTRRSTLILVWGGIISSVANAAEIPALARFDQGPALTLTEENDFVDGKDRWYTQGAKIAFFQAENDVPRWTAAFFNMIPALGFSPASDRIGYQIGHSMFTPADTHARRPDPDDRPYAGWFYTGLMLERSGVGPGDSRTLENFQLDIGIIGPNSYADQIQTWYHHNTPAGWPHQLENEPGIAVKYGRAWLINIPSAAKRYLDFIPQGGLSAGNADTSFRAGVTFRAGWNLPDNIGVQPVESIVPTQTGWSASRAGQQWGFYVFSGVEGRAVLYNAFLDGNMFQDSPHVDKEPIVGEWRSGIVLVLNRVELAYTHIFRTREFRGQPEGEVFGSFCINCKF